MKNIKITLLSFSLFFLMACGGETAATTDTDTENTPATEAEVEKLEAESVELDESKKEIEQTEAELEKMLEDL